MSKVAACLVLLVLTCPGCAFFGRKSVPVVSVKPRLSEEQLELMRVEADLSHTLAEDIDEEGTEPKTPETKVLRQSTETLLKVLGAPLEPYDMLLVDPVEHQRLAQRLVDLEKEHRKEVETWTVKIDGLNEANAVLRGDVGEKETILGRLGAGIKGVVSLLLISSVLAYAAWNWFVKRSLPRTVLSITLGGLLLYLWLVYAEQVMLVGLVVVGAVLVYYAYRAFRGSRIEDWFKKTIVNVQAVRSVQETEAALAKVDEKLVLPKAGSDYVDKQKEKAGLESAHVAIERRKT